MCMRLVSSLHELLSFFRCIPLTHLLFLLHSSTHRNHHQQVLQYMQTQCDAAGVFPATFVKDLKPWLESQVCFCAVCL